VPEEDAGAPDGTPDAEMEGNVVVVVDCGVEAPVDDLENDDKVEVEAEPDVPDVLDAAVRRCGGLYIVSKVQRSMEGVSK
jgi:hypothetical protein